MAPVSRHGGSGAQAKPAQAKPGQGARGSITRQAVLDAAIARFGREGFRAASVADIARDASVGGTVPYAYFAGKEALFFAAVDEDAAGVIREGLSSLDEVTSIRAWPERVILTLLDALERHPLARRLLAGLEPEVTVRVLDMPALAELRKAAAEQLRVDQDKGQVRSDIDPVVIANGLVAIVLSLLMSLVQLGPAGVTLYGEEVAAVLAAAIEVPARRGPAESPE
ncbi:MAG: TetR/AcrR family transcriptional regulator [Actinomycetota bacterium]|nr:TetR/AcrR family transcriptional regulator [Actinomycetota bacterium]